MPPHDGTSYTCQQECPYPVLINRLSEMIRITCHLNTRGQGAYNIRVNAGKRSDNLVIIKADMSKLALDMGNPAA